jgi:hypothetical protein
MESDKYGKMDILDLLDDLIPLRLGYWFFIPIYLVWFILFTEKSKDPLGLYASLTESGAASYD